MIPRRSNRRRSESELAPIRKEVSKLFDEAEKYFLAGEKRLARRRVHQARRIAMKARMRIPEHAGRYCRTCEAYLKLGVTSTMRIRGGVRITRCLECGSVRRRIID